MLQRIRVWLERRRRWKKYVQISQYGALRIDPRYYTESPAWGKLMLVYRRKPERV